MKKEYNWKVTVDGEKHLVHCNPFKTVFDVYVDGDLVERVGRDDSDGLDTEYDVTVAGYIFIGSAYILPAFFCLYASQPPSLHLYPSISHITDAVFGGHSAEKQ